MVLKGPVLSTLLLNVRTSNYTFTVIINISEVICGPKGYLIFWSPQGLEESFIWRLKELCYAPQDCVTDWELSNLVPSDSVCLRRSVYMIRRYSSIFTPKLFACFLSSFPKHQKLFWDIK
jgi:hypothetical protein